MLATLFTLALAVAGSVPTHMTAQAGAKQEQAAPSTAAGARFMTERAGQCWTGSARNADGTALVLDSSPASIATDLAAVKLLVEVDREFDEALAKLQELRARASRVPHDDDAWKSIAEVALARALLLEKLGRRQEALAATHELFVPAEAQSKLAGWTFQNPWPDAVAKAQRAWNDERLVAVRTQLTLPAAPAQLDSEDFVRQALLRNDSSAIQRLGTAALPALERLALVVDSAWIAQHGDPLRVLVDVSDSRATDLLVAQLASGDLEFAGRVADLMTWHRPLTNGPVVHRSSGERLLRPGWVRVAARLLELEPFARFALEQIAPVIREDVTTPELSRSLEATARTANRDLQSKLMEVFAGARGAGRFVPVYRAALESPSAEVRCFFAERMVDHWVGEEPLAYLASSDACVRDAVARCLGEHDVVTSVGGSTSRRRPDATPRITAALESLVADPDARVRNAALWAATTHAELLTRKVEDALAASEIADHRRNAAKRLRLDHDGARERVLALAGDGDLKVLHAFDTRIESLAKSESAPSSVTVLLNALRKRLAGRASMSPNEATSVLFAIAYSRAGWAPILEEIASSKDERLLEAALSASALKQANAHFALAAGFEAPRAVEAARFALETKGRQARWFVERASAASAEARGRFLPLALDRTATPYTRLVALGISATSADPRWSGAAIELFETEAIGALDVKDWIDLGAAIQSRSEHERIQLVERALASTKVPDALARWIAAATFERTTPPPALVDAVLARWLTATAGDDDELLSNALRSLLRRPESEHGDAVERALASPKLAVVTLEMLVPLRLERYRARIAQVFEVGGVPVGANAGVMHETAVRALVNYLDDASAEILLRAAGAATDESLRELCFAGLETIRKFQDERSRWMRRKDAQTARADAVVELVKLLDDTDASVRAQAARGLGTLGAVEELPRLVKLLKDREAIVQAAAREALDVLNRVDAPTKQE